jgi:hypothetical protein
MFHVTIENTHGCNTFLSRYLSMIHITVIVCSFVKVKYLYRNKQNVCKIVLHVCFLPNIVNIFEGQWQFQDIIALENKLA